VYKLQAYDNHWTPASYSGDKSTEDPGAEYPRLARKGKDNLNNKQESTFWLREASYIRWANLEIGYNWIPESKGLFFKNLYIYSRAENLHTFSKFDLWNPEQLSAYAYPLKRSISVGLEIGLDL
jgi:hypothetical protein